MTVHAMNDASARSLNVTPGSVGRPLPGDRTRETRGYDLDAGDVLDDFEILGVLARSGMGSVLKARWRSMNQTVVLKMPHLFLEGDVVFYERFAREERVGLRLDHPSVPKIMRVESKSRPYIVMEYVEGRSLGDEVRRGCLPAEFVLNVGRQIADALVHIHAQGIVHRDLKPDNVILTEEGRVRIIDFGIALDQRSRRLTWGGLSLRLGTPEYMAPEQIRGRRGDARVDVYALGLVLYRMIAGVAAYEAQETTRALFKAKLNQAPRPLREVSPNVDPALASAVMRALATRPADRYATAAEFRDALPSPAASPHSTRAA